MSSTAEADTIVRNHVVLSMAGGFVPVPILDIAAVSACQLDMLSKLATEFRVKYSVFDAKALVTSLVGGVGARVGASLLKAIPGVGTTVGGFAMSLMSGASTYAVAQVAINEFSAGRDLSDMDMGAARRLYEQAFEKGREVASDLKDDKSSEASDIFDKLERLADLQERGLLSEEEFKLQKQKLLERL